MDAHTPETWRISTRKRQSTVKEEKKKKTPSRIDTNEHVSKCIQSKNICEYTGAFFHEGWVFFDFALETAPKKPRFKTWEELDLMLLHSCAHSFLLNSSLLWFQSCVHSGDEDKKCGTKIYVVHNLSRKQRSLSPISREKKIFLILGLCRVFPLFTVLQMHLCISTTFLLT